MRYLKMLILQTVRSLKVRSAASLIGLLHKNRTKMEGEGGMGRKVERANRLVYGVPDAVECNSGKEGQSPQEVEA